MWLLNKSHWRGGRKCFVGLQWKPALRMPRDRCTDIVQPWFFWWGDEESKDASDLKDQTALRQKVAA
jgi:hypothetical protein